MTLLAKAYTNIALIKYWGKKNHHLKIPFNSSLSVTLDAFYTETTVTYLDDLTEDVFFLDDVEVQGNEKSRVVQFMDEVRRRYHIESFAKIESWNHVPKAAGLASSASAFAALALAATEGLDLDVQALSRLARFGSGSASRSLYPGFVVWHEGVDDATSVATPIDMEPWDDFRMIVCLENQSIKPFSSTEAMHDTETTSPYFNAWVQQTKKDLRAMVPAVQKRDIKAVGVLAQTNAMAMHASLLAINRWYFEPESLRIMNIVRELQKEIPVYFTMDAGPNVKIMTTAPYVDQVCDALKDVEYVVARPLKEFSID